MDLTWLGWFFVVDMALSIPIWVYRALAGGYTKTGVECVVSAVLVALYLVGFLTIGFVHV